MPDQTVPTSASELLHRPKRADALRNYEKLVTAARTAFSEDGADASLEDIARRAEVGIGTLYRNFPTRQALLEATYVEEVESMAKRAAEVAGLDPWDSLRTWLEGFVEYAATKRAIAEELVAYLDADAELFQLCRQVLFAAGEPLLERAQEAGVVRPDVSFTELVRLAGGIALIRNSDADEIGRILAIALDGLRPRA